MPLYSTSFVIIVTCDKPVELSYLGTSHIRPVAVIYSPLYFARGENGSVYAMKYAIFPIIKADVIKHIIGMKCLETVCFISENSITAMIKNTVVEKSRM